MDWGIGVLPNKHELETVLELSNETPSILPVNADNAYWTSTTFAGEASRAWTVDLAGGVDTVQSKDEGFAAACVRSIRQASGNGTITEPSRELMWMQCPLGMAVNDAGSCTEKPPRLPIVRPTTRTARPAISLRRGHSFRLAIALLTRGTPTGAYQPRMSFGACCSAQTVTTPLRVAKTVQPGTALLHGQPLPRSSVASHRPR